MKIIELKAENIKRIKAVTIKADGKSVTIGGNNDEGKSSVIDAIEYALGGTGAVCVEPVRRGEKRAESTVDLGELIVTRRFTGNSSTLTVKTKNGEVQTSPQKILDKLVGTLTFDPMGFLRMEPRQQRETLAGLAGLNFNQIDGRYANLYQERTEANRDVNRIKANLAGKTLAPDLPEDEISIDDLLGALQKAQEHNQRVHAARFALRQKEGDVTRLAESVKEQDRVISELETRLVREKAVLAQRIEALESAQAASKKATEAANALKETDERPITEAISGAQRKNSAILANRTIRETQSELKKADEAAQKLDKACTACLDEKQKLIESAKFPLDGLSVSDDAVLFNGIPLQQASTAQQIKISTSIGIALNPTLRVMLIRDGAFLDRNSLAALHELAGKADTQLWIERVGTGDEVSVIIEDGCVKEAA